MKVKSKKHWIAAQLHSLPLYALSRGRDDGFMLIR